MRRLGDITLDMEQYLEELVDDHDLQRHEILGLIDYWIRYHRPGALEEYVDEENKHEGE